MARTRAARFSVVAILAVTLAMLLQGRAVAATASLPLDQQAWFWSSNQDITSCLGSNCVYGSVGQGPLNADGGATNPIAPGHMGVSMKKGVSDMRAYLQFDFSAIPVGSDVQSFIVTMTTSRPNDAPHVQQHATAGTSAPATTGPTGAGIDACLMGEPWGPSDGDAPIAQTIEPNGNVIQQQNEPLNIKCDVIKIAGKDDGTTWSFDLTPMAKLWVGGTTFNNGLTLRPHEGGPADSWTVELHGPAFTSSSDPPKTYVTPPQAIKTSLKYTPAIAPPPPPPPPISNPGSGGISFGNTPPATGGEVTPPAPAPSATPEPTAQTAPKQPKTPGYVWLALPLGVLGMVGLRRAVGEEEAGEQAENRVATALRRRREESSAIQGESSQEGEHE